MKLKRLLSIIDRVIKQGDQRLAAKDNQLATKDKQLVAKDKEIEALRTALANRDAAVEAAIAKYQPPTEVVEALEGDDPENETQLQDEVIAAIAADETVPVDAETMPTVGESEPTPPEVLDEVLTTVADEIVPDEVDEAPVSATVEATA